MAKEDQGERLLIGPYTFVQAYNAQKFVDGKFNLTPIKDMFAVPGGGFVDRDTLMQFAAENGYSFKRG